MFGFFKRKKEEEPAAEEEVFTPSAEEAELFERGDKLIQRIGPEAYLQNIAILFVTRARQVSDMELFGHIHTCNQMGAAAMVGNLSQIAAWKLSEEFKDGGEVGSQFLELSLKSTTDAINYMKENGIPIVYH